MDQRREIHNHACTVREAIQVYLAEKADTEDEAYLRMRDFPQNACTEASTILGIFLIEKGIHGVSRFFGYDDFGYHYWLRVGNIDIDITPDQFESCHEPVIVSIQSILHKCYLDEVRPASGSFELESQEDWLMKAYYRIRRIALELEVE